MLEVSGITQIFGGVTALDSVSFSMSKGDITGVIGPNGAGKTTLFNIITGIYRQSAGTVLLEGKDVTGLPPGKLAAWKWLEFAGIADLADHTAGSLPFGKGRLLEIARALAVEPRIILMDEPAAGLNSQETFALAQLIKRIRDLGITVVLVEHDMELVMDICDRIVVLNLGRKLAEGTPREIQESPEVIAAYLGDDD